MEAEVDKLDFNKLTNVPTNLNNLKTKVDDLDVGNLKTFPVDLKKLSDVDNEVVKNTKFNTPKAKVNNLENKIPDATTLIHINQYNTDNHSSEKRIGKIKRQLLDQLWKRNFRFDCFYQIFIQEVKAWFKGKGKVQFNNYIKTQIRNKRKMK